MTKHIARLINIGLAKETVRGTAETTAEFWLPVEAYNHEDKREYTDNESGGCTIVDTKGSEITKKWAEGGYDVKIGAEHFGLPLNSLLGSVSSTTASGETVVYDHTFTLEEGAQHQSLTIFEDTPNGDRSFANGVVSELSIAFELGKLLNYTMGAMSLTSEVKTLTPTCSSEDIFRPQDFSLKLATSVAGLDSAPKLAVISANLNMTSNVVSDDVLGSVDPQDFLNGAFGIEGDITLKMDNKTYEALALDGTQQSMRFAISNNDVTIGVSSHPGFTIDLSKCFFKEISYNKSLNDMVEQTLSFKAYYDTTTGKVIDNCVLTNTTSSY